MDPDEGVGLGREIDNRNGLGFLNPAGCLNAVDGAWKIYVHENQIRIQLSGESDRLLTGSRQSAYVVTQLVELIAEIERSNHLVFHDQDTPPVQVFIVPENEHW